VILEKAVNDVARMEGGFSYKEVEARFSECSSAPSACSCRAASMLLPWNAALPVEARKHNTSLLAPVTSVPTATT
jgi:hypothetical protein